MIYLVQILNLLSDEEFFIFIGLFSNLEEDLESLDLITIEEANNFVQRSLTFHFGFEIDCNVQLELLVNAISSKECFRLAVKDRASKISSVEKRDYLLTQAA